jgi:hypothetical protein
MHIELSRSDAELIRDLLRQRVQDLDREIDQTDRLTFKRALQEMERAVERVLGEISAVLEGASVATRQLVTIETARCSGCGACRCRARRVVSDRARARTHG